MKVAVLGATGSAGSRIVQELCRRGHTVLAGARNVSAVPTDARIEALAIDAQDATALQVAVHGCDAIVLALRFTAVNTDLVLQNITHSGVARLLIVGGAGSLMTASAIREMDTPQFPAHVRPESLAAAHCLDLLYANQQLDWVYISPSRFFRPGTRTGRFRLGKDELLVDSQGISAISQEDFAVALVDELESKRHSRQRITVGY
jgi:putative NADH-flavin reductase